MFDTKAWGIFWNLFKISMFLGFGALIGFCLGLAYTSHLYGTPPVVLQIQAWLAGDVLIDGPPPVDQSGNLMKTPMAIIPQLGACIGFGMALSTLFASHAMRLVLKTIKSGKTSTHDGDKGKENGA